MENTNTQQPTELPQSIQQEPTPVKQTLNPLMRLLLDDEQQEWEHGDNISH